MNANNKEREVRYCVTAILDLLGFSTHLEIASNDLRTSIGKEAINRLQILEDGLRLMAEERASCPEEYPYTFHHIRINDAIIATMDLPDCFRPSVGESMKRGVSVKEVGKFFDTGNFESYEDFFDAYQARLSDDVNDLLRFVGMMARFHSFINRKENAAYFPGARTIIATGYRRPFGEQRAEDFLSANFSFSNAYLADKSLHGPHFFVDNNVSQMLCANKFAKNLLRFACFAARPARFDPFDEHEEPFYLGSERVLTEPIDIILFRKSFQFRELAPYPLSYLQIIHRLSAYLESGKQPAQVGKFSSMAGRVLKAIISGPKAKEASSAISFTRMDLEDDIRIFPEIIELGESPTFKRIADEQSRKELFLPLGKDFA